MATGRRLLGAVLVAGLVLGTGAIVAAKADAALPGHYQGTVKNAGFGTAVPDGWQPFDRTSNGGRALQFKVATAGAAHRSTAKTPVTACPISPADLSGGTVSPAQVPSSAAIPSSISVPAKTTVFGTGAFPGYVQSNVLYTLGPAGYACTADSGADGFFGVKVSDPANGRHTIFADVNPGGIGLNFDLPCPYIPDALAAAKTFRGDLFPQDLCSRPTQDMVTQIPTGMPGLELAAVRVPANVNDPALPSSGNGTDTTVAVFTARLAGPADIASQEADCTLPATEQAVCAAALEFFLTQSDLASHLGPANLGSSLAELANFVSPWSLNAKFGTTSADRTIAGFPNAIAPGTRASEYSATVSWGDGSITPAAVSASPNSPSELDVSGSHTYWVPGDLSASITIINAPSKATQTFGGAIHVASKYVGMGDSYSSGEGANWPPGRALQLPGCSWSLYQDQSGKRGPTNTDVVTKSSTLSSGDCQPPIACQLNPLNAFGCGEDTDSDSKADISGKQKDADGDPQSDRWQGDVCHRATTAFAHVFDKLLAIPGLTLTFDACSGAVTHDAYLPAGSAHARNDDEHRNEMPQVNSLDPSTSLVTITMGGNEISFAGDATTCVTPGKTEFDCLSPEDDLLKTLGYTINEGGRSDGQFDYNKKDDSSLVPPKDFPARPSTQDLEALAAKSDTLNLHDRLVLLYRVIRRFAPGARIIVLGYPRFFPSDTSNPSAAHFSPLEQRWANERIAVLNGIVHDAVHESGVAQFVDVYGALNNHELSTGNPDFTVNQSNGDVSCNGGEYINDVDLIAGSRLSPELLHPNPCGHQVEGQLAATAYQFPPAPSDTFSIPKGSNHMTTIPVTAGTPRLTITAQWTTGKLKTSLTGPGSKAGSVASEAPRMSGDGDTLYATWTVSNPAPGQWTLTETNENTGDSGTIIGQVSARGEVFLPLPPAGKISVTNHHGNFPVGCHATFQANVDPSRRADVASYTWFDETGNQQSQSGPSGNTIEMDSIHNAFKVILRTTGVNGQDRYSFYQGSIC